VVCSIRESVVVVRSVCERLQACYVCSICDNVLIWSVWASTCGMFCI
jgi:hypothetical protein